MAIMKRKITLWGFVKELAIGLTCLFFAILLFIVFKSLKFA